MRSVKNVICLFLCQIRYMAKTRVKSRKNKSIYIILALSLFVSLGYLYIRNTFTPQSAGVFVIETTALQYGSTTISGTLQKSSPLGADGSYLVVLPDTRIVILDVKDMDQIVGSSVVVSGVLSAPSITNDQLTMQVSKITVK